MDSVLSSNLSYPREIATSYVNWKYRSLNFRTAKNGRQLEDDDSAYWSYST